MQRVTYADNDDPQNYYFLVNILVFFKEEFYQKDSFLKFFYLTFIEIFKFILYFK